MQHAGLQYGQGAANSHQSPPFAHADISQTNGGNTTSSLRQFRKKDGTDKNSSTDLNTSVESSHIARVPPHNHYPARPNDYYRYQHQYPDYSLPYKETPAQVKYSEIAETPPQSIQHVDHIPAALQKHKEVHKDFMDMCNISQQTHMKQNYPDNLTRQQSYPPDAASVHHQYLHKEPQVHPGYKPESQYQQYPQIPKYNMPSQCRKYPPPPPENDFLAKLQRINPSMARSIMSDHHIRESQTTYPSMDQNRMYSQNQRYYPTHLQNNLSYNYQPYNYPSSCNYKHPEYPRSNQMGVTGTQYPSLNPHTERSISPRNVHMMNYGTSPQKISPNYSQYTPPEYAQHYQHRRTSIPQDYYQQTCRTNPYMAGHQISPEPADNRTASGGLRHYIENWAEEEGADITPIFKENIRIHNNESSSNEQVFVINSSDIPQCLENVSLVPTENGQYIIKTGALDNSVVKIKETTETNGERTVNVQIVEAGQKPDCMLAEEAEKTTIEATPTVPYHENQNEKVCDEITKSSQPVEEQQEIQKETTHPSEEIQEKNDESSAETSVIVSNEVSVIKDMPLIDEEQAKIDAERGKSEEEHSNAEKEEEKQQEKQQETQSKAETVPDVAFDDTTDNKDETTNQEETEEDKEVPEESVLTSTTKRTQRIFSVDDIINNIGSSPTETRRNSLQFVPKGTEEEVTEESVTNDKVNDEEVVNDEMEYRNAISVDDDSVILEIGGAWVQLNIDHLNGTKVLRVLPLSESLVIDVNRNDPASEETGLTTTEESSQNPETTSETVQNIDPLDENEATDLAKNLDEENQLIELSEKLDDEHTTQQKEVAPSEESSPKTDPSQSNVQQSAESEEILPKKVAENLETDVHLEEISSSVYQSEIVIGEEILENEVFLDLTHDATTQNASTETTVHNPTVVKEDTKSSTVVEEEDTKKIVETNRRRDEKRRSKDGEERRRSSSKKIRTEERKESEDRSKTKKMQKSEENDKVVKKTKTETKRDTSEEPKKKDISSSKKVEKKVTSQTSVNEEDVKKKDKHEEVLRTKKQDKRLTPQNSVDENDVKRKDKDKQEEVSKIKKLERRLTSQTSVNNEEEKKEISESSTKVRKQERKLSLTIRTKQEDETSKLKTIQEESPKSGKKERKLSTSVNTVDDRPTKEKEIYEDTRLIKNERKLPPLENVKDESDDKVVQEVVKPVINEETVTVNTTEKEISERTETKSEGKSLKEKKSISHPIVDENNQKPTDPHQTEPTGEEITNPPTPIEEIKLVEDNKKDEKPEETIEYHKESQEVVKEGTPPNSADVVRLAEEMIARRQLEETKEAEKLPTKAAKKLYVNNSPLISNVAKEIKLKAEETAKPKKTISKLEETVNKIKSLKEKVDKDNGRMKKTSMKDTTERRNPKTPKKVTFNLETVVREISKEEIDRKKLSLEEYNSRKRKAPTHFEPEEEEEMQNKIMEDTVTSTGDVNDEIVEEVELSIENVIKDAELKKSPLKMAPSNWENDTPSPQSPIKDEVMSTTNRKCIIDVNEFNIKPIESVSTPSPVSSSQFSYHSEDDSLQVYKDVVDSKLNSLNIKIPKLSKPKPFDRLTVLLDRFLNKGSLNCEELEEVKKFIEIKRKMLEEKKLTYEVKGERDYKDLKLHFKKVPEKRKKKRFRNLYTEDSSEDSDSSRSEKGVGDYSVYQRDSQGVPKLIFKRKSGLPQPFVKLERSQAVELLAKKRKLY
ncbi:hypothetical protein Zmor_018432 [Zophobas morio]|uniref:Uncharacterized protein n=1 Tax=Zophobas morio TaxID=2755281 RepID=A0AA38IBM6_9CUCU|nr:hypothetical protein Zmor_018432 [Zophobas morio]